MESQVETGTPYMVYKDHCNRKSNQQNLGTIKCSNLCTEIVEFSSPKEVRFSLEHPLFLVPIRDCFQTAVCNLASIAVNMFVTEDCKYNFAKLKEITKIVTRNLNKVIDVNHYPTPEVFSA